nr:MAG TPA: hypothetical protein [Bacteriophage sp.]
MFLYLQAFLHNLYTLNLLIFEIYLLKNTLLISKGLIFSLPEISYLILLNFLGWSLPFLFISLKFY